MLGNYKKIYIIRHGQTEFNRLGIVQGSGIDSDLNTTGIEQAQAFYEFYKDEVFDKIYTSTLKRTHQSVNNFIEKGIIWEQHEGLNEISWGNREGKLPGESDNRLFAEITEKWNTGITNLRFDEGESPEDVAQRQADFLEMMISKKEEKNILISMHGRALKILLAKLIANDLSKMDTFEHTNLCLYVLKYDYDSKTFELLKYNDTTHLNY